MRYRVYDDRNNETIFESENRMDCILFMNQSFEEESEDYDHMWFEDLYYK